MLNRELYRKIKSMDRDAMEPTLNNINEFEGENMNIRKKAAALIISAALSFTGVVGATSALTVAASAAQVSISASHSPGAYMNAFTLKFEKDKNTKLYYTTNGEKPTTSSQAFSDEGLKIKKTATVRILAVKGSSKSYYTYDYFISGCGNLYDLKSKYYYSKLSGKAKKAYERIVEALDNRSETVRLADLEISFDEFLKAENAVYYECPEYCLDWDLGKTVFASGKTMADGKLGYLSTRSDAKKLRAKVEKKTAALLERMKALPDDLSKVRYAAEYIICNTVYDDSDKGFCYCAVGPLVKGKAVCKGYSDSFTYIMQAAGIPAMDIHAKLREEGGHAANMVCIDGKWCNFDVTWCDAAEAANIRFDYYLTSDEVFSGTHTKDYGEPLLNPIKLPKSGSNEYHDKAVKDSSGLWTAALSFNGKGLFTLDTKNTAPGEAFSFSIQNTSPDLSYIQRTYETEPGTKYRLSAYVRYSGYKIADRFRGQASGACIGKPDGSAYSAFVTSGGWKKLTFEFTAGSDERLTQLALYNGMWASDCKGTALFSGITLEKYKNGRWIVDDSALAIGSGFSNLFDAQKKLSSLSFADMAPVRYTGKAIKPDVTVTDGTKRLTRGKDYVLSYSNNKSVGTASVTIWGKGLYTGRRTLTFDIIPAQPVLSVSRKNTSAIVSWTSRETDGAFVYVSVDGGDFKLVKAVEGKNSLSVKVKNGHKYQFAVCTYKVLGSKTIYSEYSYSQIV